MTNLSSSLEIFPKRERPKTFVIAEPGSCADGDLLKLDALLRAAKEAGADAFKMQYWSSAERLAARRNAADYLPIYQRYRTTFETLLFMQERCAAVGVEFMCTVYLPEDVLPIEPLVKRFKVASFEAQDKVFVLLNLAFGKEVIVSTGMSDWEESPLAEVYRYSPNISWLHCTSAYPAPVEDLNLSVLQTWQGYGRHFGVGGRIGLSDHSAHPITGALAVMYGAQIIEAHLRLDTTDPANPDYPAALNPADFAAYVRNIRFAEQARGDSRKRLQPSEVAMAKYLVKPGLAR